MDATDDTASAEVSGSSRFAKLSVDRFNIQQQSIKTKQATKYAVTIVTDFLKDRGIHDEFGMLGVQRMNEILSDFYTNVRNKDGNIYSKSSMIAVRQGLRRFLQEPPYNRDIDIITDQRFHKANATFKNMLKYVRSEGKGVVQHKHPIHPGDLKTLYQHPRALNPDTPQGLVNKVIFEVLFFFCRRGRENLRELKGSDFAIKTDPGGREYVLKTVSEKTKNHQGTSNENEGDGARMFATGGLMCPVKSFKKYIDKRNKKCESFFQHPKYSYLENESEWYDNKAIGKNTLGMFMVNLSKMAGLTEEYTNHSIRATTITLLNNQGFKDRDIVSVSGHRSTTSLSSYVSDTSAQVKMNMSDTLSNVTNQVVERKPEAIGLDSTENILPLTSDLDVLPVDFPDIDDAALCDVLNEIDKNMSVCNASSTSLNRTETLSFKGPHFNISNCVVTINNISKT